MQITLWCSLILCFCIKLHAPCLYTDHVGLSQFSFLKWDWVLLQGLICLFRPREFTVLWPWRSAIFKYDCFFVAVSQSPGLQPPQNTTSKWISLSANSLWWLIRKQRAIRVTPKENYQWNLCRAPTAAQCSVLFGSLTSSQLLLFLPERRMDSKTHSKLP